MVFGTAHSEFGDFGVGPVEFAKIVKQAQALPAAQRPAFWRSKGFTETSPGSGKWSKKDGLSIKKIAKIAVTPQRLAIKAHVKAVKAAYKSPLVRQVAKVAAVEAIRKFAPPGTSALVTSAAGRVTAKLGPTATRILKPAAAQAARSAFRPPVSLPTPPQPQYQQPMYQPEAAEEYPYPQDSLTPMQQELEERGFDVERVPAEEEMAGFGAARGGLGLVLGLGAAVGVGLFFTLRR
jgi:hypothetical protein